MPDFARCRSCQAPIHWTTTEHGRNMPVDAEPVEVRKGFRLVCEGEILDEQGVADAQGPILAVHTSEPLAGERLYVAHFSTCPNAAAHRR